MSTCLVCQHSLEPFLSFGRMPLANAFLNPPWSGQEFMFDLAVGRCEHCEMVQLCERVPDAHMFHDGYAYHSSTSAGMRRHFAAFAEEARRRLPSSGSPFVVEIGCNDGILLEAFRTAGIRHLGIDPAGNVLAEAAGKGLTVRQAFFTEQTASDITSEFGPADLVVAANVMCHVADIHSVFAGVRRLLTPSGLFVFEDPYVGAILDKNAVDQIYDEHVFYFSLSSVGRVAGMHGLEVVDVSPQDVHGGELRYYVGHQGVHVPAPRVRAWRDDEQRAGVCSEAAYRSFATRAAIIRDGLTETIHGLVARGNTVAGYGATSKSATIINYCGLGPGDIEYIADVTSSKQGQLTPGAHIPVRTPEYFHSHPPDYAVLFAWNHEKEILGKEAAFEHAGGRWITYVPDVAIRRASTAGTET